MTTREAVEANRKRKRTVKFASDTVKTDEIRSVFTADDERTSVASAFIAPMPVALSNVTIRQKQQDKGARLGQKDNSEHSSGSTPLSLRNLLSESHKYEDAQFKHYDAHLVQQEKLLNIERNYTLSLRESNATPHKYWVLFQWHRIEPTFPADAQINREAKDTVLKQPMATDKKGQVILGPYEEVIRAVDVFRRRYVSLTGYHWKESEVSGEQNSSGNFILVQKSTNTKVNPTDADCEAEVYWQYYVTQESYGRPCGWYSFDEAISERCEQLFQCYIFNPQLSVRMLEGGTGKSVYRLNFHTMTQTNVDGIASKPKVQRSIRRLLSAPSVHPHDSESNVKQMMDKDENPKAGLSKDFAKIKTLHPKAAADDMMAALVKRTRLDSGPVVRPPIADEDSGRPSIDSISTCLRMSVDEETNAHQNGKNAKPRAKGTPQKRKATCSSNPLPRERNVTAIPGERRLITRSKSKEEDELLCADGNQSPLLPTNLSSVDVYVPDPAIRRLGRILKLGGEQYSVMLYLTPRQGRSKSKAPPSVENSLSTKRYCLLQVVRQGSQSYFWIRQGEVSKRSAPPQLELRGPMATDKCIEDFVAEFEERTGCVWAGLQNLKVYKINPGMYSLTLEANASPEST